jgi:hypothetical protein
MAWYNAMYPSGQQGLPDDPVAAYMDALRAFYTAPGSVAARRGTPASLLDFRRECFLCDI